MLLIGIFRVRFRGLKGEVIGLCKENFLEWAGFWKFDFWGVYVGLDYKYIY